MTRTPVNEEQQPISTPNNEYFAVGKSSPRKKPMSSNTLNAAALNAKNSTQSFGIVKVILKTASKPPSSNNFYSATSKQREGRQSEMSGKLSSCSSECRSVYINLVENQIDLKPEKPSVSTHNGIQVAVKAGITPMKKAQQLGFVPILEGLKQKIQREETQ